MTKKLKKFYYFLFAFFTTTGGEYKPFEGCLRNVEVNSKAVDLANDVIKGGAVMGGCAKAE